MKTSSVRLCLILASLCLGLAPQFSWGQGTEAQQVLSDAAAEQRYTFILFWKQNDAPTKTVSDNLAALLKSRAAEASMVTVRVTDPKEQEVVKRFDVSRAPMPLVLAIAPNGAVTGHFQTKLTAELLDRAFVTPCMSTCMKSMQGGKLVLVCAQSRQEDGVPAGVREFQADPDFAQRTVVVQLPTEDPAEARFLQQLQINPQDAKPYVALLAPPGVLVGKFYANVTKDQLAAKLHAAGKCCDDENCKHNKKGN